MVRRSTGTRRCARRTRRSPAPGSRRSWCENGGSGRRLVRRSCAEKLERAAAQPATTTAGDDIGLGRVHSEAGLRIPRARLEADDHALLQRVAAVARAVRALRAAGRRADRMLRSGEADALDGRDRAPAAARVVGGLADDRGELAHRDARLHRRLAALQALFYEIEQALMRSTPRC